MTKALPWYTSIELSLRASKDYWSYYKFVAEKSPVVYPLEALSREAAKSSSLCPNLDMSKPYAGYMCYMEVAQATG